jgi:hypothetical protein
LSGRRRECWLVVLVGAFILVIVSGLAGVEIPAFAESSLCYFNWSTALSGLDA